MVGPKIQYILALNYLQHFHSFLSSIMAAVLQNIEVLQNLNLHMQSPEQLLAKKNNHHADFRDLLSLQLIPLWNPTLQIPAAFSSSWFQFLPPRLNKIDILHMGSIFLCHIQETAFRHQIRSNAVLTSYIFCFTRTLVLHCLFFNA